MRTAVWTANVQTIFIVPFRRVCLNSASAACGKAACIEQVQIAYRAVISYLDKLVQPSYIVFEFPVLRLQFLSRLVLLYCKKDCSNCFEI